ncbi:MAG TPA: M20/M25/M40 family metallo-hydrolase, partial [Nitrolancea sp.]|nr:M20/M25/M40 family metallo-hydrolase [Nitrolancea sp.]
MDETWLESSSDVEEAAKLTAHLVSFRSYPGQEGAVQRAVAAWLRENGVESEFQATEGDRPNVIARIENGDGPTFMLNGHVDTVLAAEGWETDPWQATRDGNRLYGLGACDMKAGIAAAMLASRALNQRRDLWHGTVLFTSVVDEEAFSIGARALVDAQTKADACVCLESAWEHPVLGAAGKVLVRGDVIGKAAHGAYPQLGINAAVESAKFLARVDDLELGQHPRLIPNQCVLGVQSGSAQYVITVPETARFTINRHIVPGETGETVLAQMRELAESLHSPARFELTIDPPYYPPWEIAPDQPFVQQFAQAYQTETGNAPDWGYSAGVADANYFASDLGIPTVHFGPHGANYHQSNEWVDVTT